MNFTEKLIADQAALAAELATLRETVAALTAPKPKPEPAKVDSRPDPIVRDHARDDEHHQAYMERIQRQAIAHREQEAGYLADRKAGLSNGEWRDDCGLVRGKDGKIVPSGRALENKLAREAEHNKRAQEEDFAWRRLVELPIRGEADDDAE